MKIPLLLFVRLSTTTPSFYSIMCKESNKLFLCQDWLEGEHDVANFENRDIVIAGNSSLQRERDEAMEALNWAQYAFKLVALTQKKVEDALEKMEFEKDEVAIQDSRLTSVVEKYEALQVKVNMPEYQVAKLVKERQDRERSRRMRQWLLVRRLTNKPWKLLRRPLITEWSKL